MKYCPKCKRQLPESAFGLVHGKLFSYCRECKRDSDRRSHAKHKEVRNARTREAYAKSPDKIRARNRADWLKHADARRASSLRYRETHKAEIKARAVAYRLTHKPQRNKHESERRATDVEYRLRCYLRNKLRKMLVRKSKHPSALVLLGCSVKHLEEHISTHFQPGMTWNNWAPDGWHIDHIRPLSSFNLQDPEQLKQAVHYTNLQPLWAIDNILKGARIPSELPEIVVPCS